MSLRVSALNWGLSAAGPWILRNWPAAPPDTITRSMSPRLTRSVPAVLKITLPVNVVFAATVREVPVTDVFDAIVTAPLPSVVPIAAFPPLIVVALNSTAETVPLT